MMKRNGNIVSFDESSPGKGISDTFDNFIKNSAWPTVLKIVSVTNSSGNQLENALYSHTVTSTGLEADETLYWKVQYANNTTSTDFYSGVVQGIFTQSASTQTGSFNIEHDFIGDPNKSLRRYSFQILRGGYSGDVLYNSSAGGGGITILTPTLGNISWISSPVNEGSSANLNFYLTNCGTNRSRTFTLTNTGTASSADFSSPTPLLTSRSQNPAASTNVTYTTANDLTTEGSETLTVAISYGGYSSWGSATLTITDTSVFPSISSVTPSTTNVTEGGTVTFTVTDSTGSSGTLYWTINTSGGVSAADFTPATLSGSFTLSSGSGTIDITPVPSDGTESETFTLEVRYGSTSGTILATSTTVTITDATGAAPGGAVFTTTGSHSWTVPAGVTIVHVVCVGGGGGSHTGVSNLSYNGANGAGGGGLAYGNNISVTPGSSISIFVGAGGTAQNNALGTAGAGGDSWFSSSAYLNGGGGDPATYTSATTSNLPNALGGTSTGTARSGGGSGGNGGILTADGTGGGGGGGAGGYSGNGGNGGNVTSSAAGSNGTAGSGGGGGGGGSTYNPAYGGASGGGVGIYGQGSNGTAGISGSSVSTAGGGGSGGNNGQTYGNGSGTGGTYGGGGAGGGDNPGGATNSAAATGAQGAVRVIWGTGRAFPSTNADLASSTAGETTY